MRCCRAEAVQVQNHMLLPSLKLNKRDCCCIELSLKLLDDASDENSAVTVAEYLLRANVAQMLLAARH